MKSLRPTAIKPRVPSPQAAAVLLGFFLMGGAMNRTSASDAPTPRFELPGNAYHLSALAFSRDVQWLAAWRLPDQMELWDVGKGSRVAVWTEGPAGPWSSLPGGHRRPLAFLEDGKRILVASATNVAVHDLLSGKVEQALDDSGPDLGQISISPDGHRVVGVTAEGEFAFWSLPDVHRLTHLPTHRAQWEGRGSPFNFNGMALRRAPTSMSPETDWAFSPDGKAFAIGRVFAVDLWDSESGRWLSRYSGMDVPDFRIGAPTFGGGTRVAFLSTNHLAVVCGGAFAVLGVGTNLAALAVTNPASPPMERLDIRALGVSADGTRFAVAGMRMGSRPSFGDPGAGAVFDVPQHGEIQVWNAVPLRLLVTIKGTAEEKFGVVALDAAGKRVAAITTGLRYTAHMNQSQQQAAERSPPGPYVVAAWDVP